MSSGTDTVVFIPAWNEEANLPAVLTELHSVLLDADVLVLDDGSTDGTGRARHGCDRRLLRREPRSPRRNRCRVPRVATEVDVVVLSGWARVPGSRSEAELMAAAWKGTARELVVDPDARTTVGNAANALNDIRRVDAREVVVVTSRWHAPRAKAAFRLLLRGSRVRVVAESPPETRAARALLRELPLWALLPA